MWTQASFAIDQEYAGRTLRLHFSADVDDKFATFWYVDEVSFYQCERVPTAVGLTRLEALPDGPVIRIEWETATEIDDLGYNLYRSDTPGEAARRLNEDLIASQVSGSPMGAVYAWSDADVKPGETYSYELEKVDVHGAATPSGRLEVTAAYVVYLPVVLR